MDRPHWHEILLSVGNQDEIWELFHENSKVSRFSKPLLDEEILARMKELQEVLPFEGYPVVELPPPLSLLKSSLTEAIMSRVSCRDMEQSSPLQLIDVATLLHYAYGVTRRKSEADVLRSFRVVPSGGGLYPLEIFFHSPHVEGIENGLYHYNPLRHHLRLLKGSDITQSIADATVYPDLVLRASLVIFITAVFERSVFKYRDRGYRFILLEAGHVAQNINLVATGLGLGSVNIGGYFDRDIDKVLDLDGVTHSTVYMIALGKQEYRK